MTITGAHWIFLDTETTGIPKKGQPEPSIIELGWCVVKNMQIEGSTDFLINPGSPIPPVVQNITHITDEMVQGEPAFKDIAHKFLAEYQEADFIAAFNKDFDRQMLEIEYKKLGIALPQKTWLDPLNWSRAFESDASHKLGDVAKRFNVSLENAHRADADAKASAEIMIRFFQWGIEEANFPDDVEALKSLEVGWRNSYRAKSRIMQPLKDPATGKVKFTGEPGKLPNVADGVSRATGEDYLRRLMQEKWRRR